MTLRTGVVVFLCAGIALALVLDLFHAHAAWSILGLYFALGLTAILIERGRYRPVLTGSDFVVTPERYRDPVTGQTVSVYVDAATGEREYRAEPAAGNQQV